LLHPAHLPSLISFPTRRSSDLIVSFISWRTRFFSRSSSILYNLSASALPNRFNEPSFLYAEDSLDMSPLSKASLTANIRDLTESFTLLLNRIREKAAFEVSPAPASIRLLAALATLVCESECSLDMSLISKASLTANIRDLTESFTLLLDRLLEKASSNVSPAPASILLFAALATFASEAESSFNFILLFNSAHLLLLPNSV